MHGFSSWIFNNVFQKLKKNVKQFGQENWNRYIAWLESLYEKQGPNESHKRAFDLLQQLCAISKFIKYWIYKRSKELKSDSL